MRRKKPEDDWLKIAILYDQDAKYSPSNFKAIEKFIRHARIKKILASIIGESDIANLRDYDGLFIRDTTSPDNYTYRFSKLAEELFIPVLDSTRGILIGCDKIWQSLQFYSREINHPQTFFVQRVDFELNKKMKFPIVMKLSNSSFSQGVYLARSIAQLNELIEKHGNNRYVIVQEYVETTYDWRIGVLDKKILFACKYYMAQNDWRIIKYDRQGDLVEGSHENVSIAAIPKKVLSLVKQCMPLLDHGLYGIDIKETSKKCYVIEVNDNANIDAGVEDEIETDIYDKILDWFFVRFKHVNRA